MKITSSGVLVVASITNDPCKPQNLQCWIRPVAVGGNHGILTGGGRMGRAARIARSIRIEHPCACYNVMVRSHRRERIYGGDAGQTPIRTGPVVTVNWLPDPIFPLLST